MRHTYLVMLTMKLPALLLDEKLKCSVKCEGINAANPNGPRSESL
ncbi:MAG: hypothetical protein QXQ21_01170 [Candidatus Jordarchaeales archaeon]